MIAIASLTGWSLVSGLKRGVIRSGRIGYSRAEDPSSFWFYTCGYALAFSASAGLLIYFAIEVIIHWGSR